MIPQENVRTIGNTVKQNNQKRNYKSMTKLKIKGEGNIIKGKLKQAGAKLTDDTLLDVKGKSQELLGRVQKEAAKFVQPSRNPTPVAANK